MTDAASGRNLRHRERLTARVDGEEREVFNWVTVEQPARVRGHNPVVEKYDPEIWAGDAGGLEPDAVTTWVAEELEREFGIDVSEQGIDVVDVESDEVTVL